MKNQIEEILEALKEKNDDKIDLVVKIFAIIGLAAVIAGIIYAAYRFFTPDYYEDYDDEFDDEFEEDEDIAEA